MQKTNVKKISSKFQWVFFGFGIVTNIFGSGKVTFLVKLSDKMSVILTLRVQLGQNFNNPLTKWYKYWSTFTPPTSKIWALHWIYVGYVH